MTNMNDTRYHEWTSCEFYGHNFMKEDQRHVCTDCGESFLEEQEPVTQEGG